MINKYISSKIIISRIYDDYNIQSDDFVSKVSTWIYNAIRELGIKQTYILENPVLQFHDNRVCIPIHVDRIYGVKINGIDANLSFDNINLNKTEYNGNSKHSVIGFDGSVFPNEDSVLDIYTPITEPISNVHIGESFIEFGDTLMTSSAFNLNYWKDHCKSEVNYKIVNGWIQTNIEYGVCEILCGSIPHEYAEELDTIFPIIPDDEILINCIIQYCLKNILMRGYKHPILSLATNNDLINPGLAYKNTKIAARNSCNVISPSAKESLSKLIGNSII